MFNYYLHKFWAVRGFPGAWPGGSEAGEKFRPPVSLLRRGGPRPL